MKTKHVSVKLHITTGIEHDAALIGSCMRLRRCSRRAMKLRQQYMTAKAAVVLVSSIGWNLAEQEELAAEQLWEEAYEEAES